MLLCTGDTLDLIGNFVSLVIIAEFDDYVYASMRGELLKILVEKEFTEQVLKIQHTSSKKCPE